MRYYPLYADLTRKRCLVVGAGEVGRRKIGTLAACGAKEVLVLDTRAPDADLQETLALPSVTFEQRSFAEPDLDGRFLVIASTSNEELNWHISRACEERGILCNIVDQPEKCSFIVPALFTQGDLTWPSPPGAAHLPWPARYERSWVIFSVPSTDPCWCS